MAVDSAGGAAIQRGSRMDEGQDAPRRGRFVDTLKAVGWAFFGVRKGRSHEHDMRELNPLHVILVGLLLAAVFIVVLVMLARFAAA